MYVFHIYVVYIHLYITFINLYKHAHIIYQWHMPVFLQTCLHTLPVTYNDSLSFPYYWHHILFHCNIYIIKFNKKFYSVFKWINFMFILSENRVINETQSSIIIFDMRIKLYGHRWNSVLLVMQINKLIGSFCFIFLIFASTPQNNIFKRGVSRSFLCKKRRNDERIGFIVNKSMSFVSSGK